MQFINEEGEFLLDPEQLYKIKVECMTQIVSAIICYNGTSSDIQTTISHADVVSNAILEKAIEVTN